MLCASGATKCCRSNSTSLRTGLIAAGLSLMWEMQPGTISRGDRYGLRCPLGAVQPRQWGYLVQVLFSQQLSVMFTQANTNRVAVRLSEHSIASLIWPGAERPA